MPEPNVIRRAEDKPARSAGQGETRLPEDLRALSLRIRRSEQAYERMTGKKHE